MDRPNRIRAFEHSELNGQVPSSSNPSYPNPNDVLKQYLEAKKLVDQLSARFKTEYARSFVNWTQKQGPSESKPAKSHAAGLASGYVLNHEKRVHRTVHPELVPQPSHKVVDYTKEAVQVGRTVPSPVDFVKVQSIYQSLKPAGVTEITDIYPAERRHFPNSQTLKDQEFALPTTWNLAQDVYLRAQRK